MEAVIEMNENICSKNVHVFSVKDKRDKLNYRWQVILRQTSSLTDDLLFWQQCVHECVHGHLKECYLGTVQNYLELSISAAGMEQCTRGAVYVFVWVCECVCVCGGGLGFGVCKMKWGLKLIWRKKARKRECTDKVKTCTFYCRCSKNTLYYRWDFKFYAR